MSLNDQIQTDWIYPDNQWHLRSIARGIEIYEFEYKPWLGLQWNSISREELNRKGHFTAAWWVNKREIRYRAINISKTEINASRAAGWAFASNLVELLKYYVDQNSTIQFYSYQGKCWNDLLDNELEDTTFRQHREYIDHYRYRYKTGSR